MRAWWMFWGLIMMGMAIKPNVDEVSTDQMWTWLLASALISIAFLVPDADA
jgi:uncharacterized membrane protein YhaH (DUF805 family)